MNNLLNLVRKLILLICCFLGTEVFSIEQVGYHGLIIGNNSYNDPTRQWPPLSTAVSDAKAMYKILKNDFNFHNIKLLLNATRGDIIRALNTLSNAIRKGDKVLIYYAGHGYFDENSDIGYWVPIDAEGADDSTFISNSTLRDKLNLITKKSQNTFVIIDACFSGSLLRSNSRGLERFSSRVNLGQKEIPHYYRKLESKKSAQILTSGGLEFVDDNYRSSNHSPFTFFLLEELENRKNRVFSATELAVVVQRRVADNVFQTPELGVIYGVGHVGGEFVFRPTGFVAAEIEYDTVTDHVQAFALKNNENYGSMTIGFSSWLSNWKIQSNTEFLDGAKSNLSPLYGFNLNMSKARWFGNIRYLTGERKFDALVLDVNGTSNSNRLDVKNSELEMQSGYFLNKYIATTIGYQFTTNDYRFSPISSNDSAFIESFEDGSHGASVGVNGLYPLNIKYDIFTDFSIFYRRVITKSRINPSAILLKDESNYFGYSVNVGVVRSLQKTNFKILASFKIQKFQEQKNSSEKNSYFGGIIGVSYKFGFSAG